MELGKILEFRKDLYFEGAVQADWFYTQEKAAKVEENFVFECLSCCSVTVKRHHHQGKLQKE